MPTRQAQDTHRTVWRGKNNKVFCAQVAAIGWSCSSTAKRWDTDTERYALAALVNLYTIHT